MNARDPLPALVLLLLGAAGCADPVIAPSPPMPGLGDVTAAEWNGLRERRVFFGHQSVGFNILAGVEDVIAANPQIQLTVRESKDLNDSSGAAFLHAKVGRNGHPLEKLDEFVAIAGRAESPAVGLVKFCYLDVRLDTDPDALFARHRDRMAGLRAANPGLTIVHVTMPLVADEGRLRYWKARLRGRPADRDLNVIRNRYNALLRQEYAGKEPVFDVAALESTRFDGSRTYFQRDGAPVFVLAREFTHDGGHLNPVGRRRVAEQLLIFLAKLGRPAAD